MRRPCMTTELKDLLAQSQSRAAQQVRSAGGFFRRWVGLTIAAVVVILLLPNSMTYIGPGHVGIVIHRAGGGVDPHPLGPGIHGKNPLLTQIEEYPTYMQTLLLARSSNEGSGNNDEINVNSVEGQPVSVDVSMSFELDPQKVPYLYSTFRTDIS